MTELAKLFGLRVLPGLDPDEAYLVDEVAMKKAIDDLFAKPIEIPVEPFDANTLRIQMRALFDRPIQPTAIFLHPSTYRRTRVGFAMVEISAALGGRQKGGKRRRSDRPYRERRARAMEAVRDLWRRERAEELGGFSLVSDV